MTPDFHLDRPDGFKGKTYHVGYIGDNVDSPGQTDPEVISKLKWLSLTNGAPGTELGLHTCDICGEYDDYGGILVNIEGGAYLLPQMVIHYITEHEYVLPRDVLDQVQKTELPLSEDEVSHRYTAKLLKYASGDFAEFVGHDSCSVQFAINTTISQLRDMTKRRLVRSVSRKVRGLDVQFV